MADEPIVIDPSDILSIDEMLSAPDVEYRTIPTWKIDGKQKYTKIGSLSANDLIEWREAGDGPQKRLQSLQLFVKSLVDVNGKRIGQPQHAEMLKGKSNSIIELVLKEVIELNGLTVKGTADAKKG